MSGHELFVFDWKRDFINVKGPDAASFLNNISTNDIANLLAGHWCETFFCDHRAKTLFQTNVWHAGTDGYLLDTVSGYGAGLLAHLDRFLISEAVELNDESANKCFLHCAGKRANEVVNGFASVRNHDQLGLPGFDILINPDEKAAKIDCFRNVGAIIGDDALFETLRIEAGTPIYGKDIDENRFVMEVANAARAVCYSKGCFIGQEPIVMSRDRAGQVSRLFLGVKILDGGLLDPGTRLMRDGSDAGVVTSSAFSPRLNAPMSLAYLRRPHIGKGMILQAGSQSVEVLGYPPLEPQ